jgi:hypothetical protein
MRIGTGLVAAALLALFAQPVAAQRRIAPRNDPPTRPGTCAYTHVRIVTQRLEDGVTHRVIPDSGSAVTMANGVHQVSYDQVGAVNRSRRGDPVWTCLMTLPQNCPPGDDRGKLYTTTNLRTEESWTLPDSAHGCGGA